MGHPDLKQLPAKGKPWSTLLAQDSIHKVGGFRASQGDPAILSTFILRDRRWI